MNNYEYLFNSYKLNEGDWSSKYHYSNDKFWDLIKLEQALNDKELLFSLLDILLDMDKSSEDKSLTQYIYSTKDLSKIDDLHESKYISRYQGTLQKFIYDIKSNIKGNKINIFRELLINKKDKIDFDDLGVCWTYDKKNLKYLEDYVIYDGKLSTILNCVFIRLAGNTDISNIDWLESVYLFLYYYRKEKEIRLINPKNIKLLSYVIFSATDEDSDGIKPDEIIKKKGNIDLINL